MRSCLGRQTNKARGLKHKREWGARLFFSFFFLGGSRGRNSPSLQPLPSFRLKQIKPMIDKGSEGEMKYKSHWRRDHGWGKIKIKIKIQEGMVSLVVWAFKPLVQLSLCLCCECASESRCFRSFSCLFPFLKKQQKQKPTKKRGGNTPTPKLTLPLLFGNRILTWQE